MCDILSDAHGWSSDIAGFLVEKITGQTLEDYLYEPYHLMCKTSLTFEGHYRQDNIFNPLNMEASFYLTPDIKDRLVDMTFRRENTLEAWSGQSRIMEQDPSKCNGTSLLVFHVFTY